MATRIVLIERDAALRDALAFSLELEGYEVESTASAEMVDLAASARESDCLVIAHEPRAGDLFERLLQLRRGQTSLPILVLATNPTAALRLQVARIGAGLVEKPLIGTALSEALRSLFPVQEAA